jgi:hypothetical protein
LGRYRSSGSGRPDIVSAVDAGRPDAVTTAAELEAMTPEERHASFEGAIVTDLDQVPAGLVDRVRACAQAHLE